MRRYWALAMSVTVNAPSTTVGGRPSADSDPIQDPYVFTSADVGFIDGSDPAGRAGRIADMDAYVGAKKPIIRIDLFWDQVQPCATCPPNWTALDAMVDAAHAQGVRVLLILDYAVPW